MIRVRPHTNHAYFYMPPLLQEIWEHPFLIPDLRLGKHRPRLAAEHSYDRADDRTHPIKGEFVSILPFSIFKQDKERIVC